MDTPHPRDLTWRQVAPGTHPFLFDDAERRRLRDAVTPLIPDAPTDVHQVVNAITRLLVGRYGPWACGWNWSVGEGDLDGGVVGSWCCSAHSVGAPGPTADAVVEALGEWRSWLEELAGRFDALTPSDGGPAASGFDPWFAERACTRLVTVVADRTGAESGWHGHCAQVLDWFLAHQGVDAARAARIVATATGGRFSSWVSPDRVLIDDVATRFGEACEAAE